MSHQTQGLVRILFEVKTSKKVERGPLKSFEVIQGCMGSEQFNVKLLEIGSAESKKP